MHDPASTHTLGSTASVENQGLLHPNHAGIGARLAGLYGAVLTSGFPVSSISGSVGTMAIWVLAITRAEEEPLRIISLYDRQP